jgi:D-alanyl-D-alanine carboxypeptidase/D-alanyl-D-alanine-endopeptidase (penicillin-binding protein 4)
LRDIVHDINHHSNNVMTEQVTLTLPLFAQNKQKTVTTADEKVGHSLYYQQPKSDYPAALTTIEQWWRSHLTTPPPVMTNGSGLCRTCTVTAANLAELLQYAYTHPEFAAYVDSLGIAGISGTIEAHKERLPNSHAIGRAWIKTGTLNNVTSMAGYVKGLSGEDYVVVGIINKAEALNTYEARHVLDTMLDWTAQH